jgi:hypothetical protein
MRDYTIIASKTITLLGLWIKFSFKERVAGQTGRVVFTGHASQESVILS